MVTDGYVKRLQDYITAESATHARRPGDKGVNAYSRYTERVLSEWGMSGFAAGQISRWLRGEVKADLDSHTLQRLGLLKKFSTDPETAGKLAWAWLNGEGESEPAEQQPPVVSEQPAPYRHNSGPIAVVEQINVGSFSPGELREIAIAAVEKLAAGAEGQEQSEGNAPKESALTWLLQGWMTQQGSTIADLAATIGTTVERTQRIIEGYPMTVPECKAVSALTKLKPETLAEWGLCPSLAADSRAADRI